MNDEQARGAGGTIQGNSIATAVSSWKDVGLPARAAGDSSRRESHHTRGSWRNFARHYFEMVAAMVVGMAALGGVASLALWLLGQADVFDYLPVRTLVMATNMSVGMGLWMRHQGHTWSRIVEMSAAMYAPFLALLGPYATGLVGRGALMGGGHLLMLVAMLLVMLPRYEEYAQDHSAHCRSGAARYESHGQGAETVDA